MEAKNSSYFVQNFVDARTSYPDGRKRFSVGYKMSKNAFLNVGNILFSLVAVSMFVTWLKIRASNVFFRWNLQAKSEHA